MPTLFTDPAFRIRPGDPASLLHTFAVPVDAAAVRWVPDGGGPHRLPPHPQVTEPADMRLALPAVSSLSDEPGTWQLAYTAVSTAQWRHQQARPHLAHWPAAHPAPAMCHVAVTTADRKLLLVRRAAGDAPHAGGWSASLEGAASTTDRTVADTVARTVAARFGAGTPGPAHLLAAAREHGPDGFPHGVVLFCHVAAPVDARQLARTLRGSALHDVRDRVDFLDTGDLEDVETPDGRPWHPTSPLRIELLGGTAA